MTRLFDRRVTVTVDTIEINALDCTFTIEKSLKPEPNTCELKIFNLNPDHIAQLEMLGQPPKTKQTAKAKSVDIKAKKGIPCRIEAGYKDNQSLVWLGDLRTILTRRDGPNWVTEFSSGDGEKSWQNARLHVSYGPKTSLDTALRSMVRALGVGEGNLSKVVSRLKSAGEAVYPTGVVISGSVARQITDFARSADLEVSIQDGALQFIDRGAALTNQAVVLSEATGLVGSPAVSFEGILTARMLMIPDVRCGGLVVVEGARLKGQFRVTKATWTGSTSDTDFYIDIEAERY